MVYWVEQGSCLGRERSANGSGQLLQEMMKLMRFGGLLARDLRASCAILKSYNLGSGTVREQAETALANYQAKSLWSTHNCRRSWIDRDTTTQQTSAASLAETMRRGKKLYNCAAPKVEILDLKCLLWFQEWTRNVFLRNRKAAISTLSMLYLLLSLYLFQLSGPLTERIILLRQYFKKL